MLRRVQLWARKAREEAETKRDMLREVAKTLKAAEQGDADAQNYLGWMYSHGYGVPKNKAEAVVKPPFYVPPLDRVSGTGGRMFRA